jgi:undecaprenyl-diphosphatase
MTVVLHFATALSTVVIFRKRILEILKGLFSFSLNEDFWFSIKIIVSMMPAAVIGLLFNDEIEALFGGQVLLVGTMLLITGLLLFLADKAKNTGKPVNMINALIVGIAQAIAILPGISRSGATISTSVLLGVDRSKAAEFSFLMVVPLIFGKVLKDVLDSRMLSGSVSIATSSDISYMNLGIGFVAAFISGMLACTWMIALVKKSELKYFAIYCFVVGFGSILYTYFS